MLNWSLFSGNMRHAFGKLKEVFEEYDLAVKLECRFSNDKGKELIIVSKCTDINVDTASTILNSIYSDWELYKLEEFYNAISKLYVERFRYELCQYK
ncbi:MAG: hypothetical protein NTU70_09755 [Methylococcales bacterium]|nr:hypothetical protein [Methylococcales bacterium]